MSSFPQRAVCWPPWHRPINVDWNPWNEALAIISIVAEREVTIRRRHPPSKKHTKRDLGNFLTYRGERSEFDALLSGDGSWKLP